MPLSQGPSGAAMSTGPTQQPDTAPHEHPLKQGVFLHTGWRSAGTWVWSRLRALDTATAFYEPLSNVLADLSLADVVRVASYADVRPSAARHAVFPTSTGRFFRTARVASKVIESASASIDSLPRRMQNFPRCKRIYARYARRTLEQGRVPVFKFCRSSGRLPWLKQAFPEAMQVGVLRNPASQFASGWLLSRQWSNAFFVAAPFRVLGLNQTDPLVRDAINVCGVSLPPVAPTSDDAYALACEQYARTAEGNNAYRAFVALWMLGALRMAEGVDLLVDIDRLGQSRDYAVGLRAAFDAQSGLSPDFGNARDLVDETRRSAARISGIDGRSMRTVHSAALKFLKTHGATDTAFVDKVREKMVLANELTDLWR